jgi:putative CocE/NonD family hydrolase
VPTILTITPYLRRIDYRVRGVEALLRRIGLPLVDWGHEFTRFGYACVMVEMRGAGASFGRKKSVMAPDVIRDGSQVLDWIVDQSWSNGAVGYTGISADAMAGLWLVTAGHSALRAIAPRSTVFDIFRATHPGGLTSGRLIGDVGKAVRALDTNRIWQGFPNPLVKAIMFSLVRGAAAVDGLDGRSLLAEAVAEHRHNQAFDQDLLDIAFRDDPLPQAGDGSTLEVMSPAAYADLLTDVGIPIFVASGWLDSGFGREMISLHNTVRNPGSRLLIGPWEHHGALYCSPTVSGRVRTSFDQLAELVRFFDLHLRGVDHRIADESPVHYYTMGEEAWNHANRWPPEGIRTVPWYLGSDGELVRTPGSAPGADRYEVDFTVGTGAWSRFGSMRGRPHGRPDRRACAGRRLSYTGAPLAEAVEVTGDPVVHLELTTTATDGALIVYLEDVAPDGTILPVTEGHLRLRHRSASRQTPTFWHPGPWHSCDRHEAVPTEPGQTMSVGFALHPISWLFGSGHAIRMSVAGADADNFAPISADEAPVLTVHTGGEQPSRLELPVIARSNGGRGAAR